MKNSIIFYIVLLGAAFGGIKWTTHSIFEKKKEALNKVDLHKQLEMNMQGDSLGDMIKGKQVVIFLWDTDNEATVEDIKTLNALAETHPNSQFIAVNSTTGEPNGRKFLNEKKVNFQFPSAYTPDWMLGTMTPVFQVYGSEEEAASNGNVKTFDENNLVIVIGTDGKVREYYTGKISEDDDLVSVL